MLKVIYKHLIYINYNNISLTHCKLHLLYEYIGIYTKKVLSIVQPFTNQMHRILDGFFQITKDVGNRK